MDLRVKLPPHNPQVRKFVAIVDQDQYPWRMYRVRAWWADELELQFSTLRWVWLDDTFHGQNPVVVQIVTWILEHHPPCGPVCRDWGFLFTPAYDEVLLQYFASSNLNGVFDGGRLLAFDRERPVLPKSSRRNRGIIPHVGLARGDLMSSCGHHPDPEGLLKSLSVVELEAYWWRTAEASRPVGELDQDQGNREYEAHPHKDKIQAVVQNRMEDIYRRKFGREYGEEDEDQEAGGIAADEEQSQAASSTKPEDGNGGQEQAE